MHGLPDRTYAVYLGLDVGEGEHHACALDPTGRRLHDKPLPQDETRLRALYEQLAGHGPVLVVVDQPASIGALPVAVARAAGVDIAYLPGLAMRRIADLHPGNAKTDTRDAHVIAEAARTMPHTLRRVDMNNDALADLEVIVGFDDDLAGEVTRVTNRIHGLLTQIHPALERAIGNRLHHKSVLEVLSRFGGPTGLRAAGRRRLLAVTRPRAPRSYEKLVEAIWNALDEQTVTVPGTRAAELVLPKLAEQLADLLRQRQDAATQVQEILDAHPLSTVLTSMPGVGVRTAARILLEVGDGTAFPTPGHLAAYAGLAPVTRRSGSSIRGEHPSRGGNKNLKRALFLSAFAALSDPTSRAYYDRKRTQGKRHNAALICLARRRYDVLYAMLRDGTTYQAHAVWALAEPITRAECARHKPLAYAAAVTEGLRRALDGDQGHSGLITKNPQHKHWHTQWISGTPRSLDELAAGLGDRMPPPDRRRSKGYRENVAGLGRNCLIFETARTWAYREARKIRLRHEHATAQDTADLLAAITAHAGLLYAEFSEPLPICEVRAIAASIHRWITTKFDGHHPDLARSCLDRLGDATAPRVLDAALACGTQFAAVSAGGGPLRWRTRSGPAGAATVTPSPVDAVDAVDTLAAGDVLHGAYCYARARWPDADPGQRLHFAAAVATRSCLQRGTRTWLASLGDADLPHPGSGTTATDPCDFGAPTAGAAS